jgi:hypothetical protein
VGAAGTQGGEAQLAFERRPDEDCRDSSRGTAVGADGRYRTMLAEIERGYLSGL